MFVPNFIEIHPTDVKTFQSKSQIVRGKEDQHQNSSSGDHECLYQMSWQTTQYLFRYFSNSQKHQPAVGTRGKVIESPKSVCFILWGP